MLIKKVEHKNGFLSLSNKQPPITRKQTLIRTPALEGTSPPPDTFFSQIKPNGAVTDGSVLPNGTSEKNNKKKLQSQSHEAKEYLLTSHKISNVSWCSKLVIMGKKQM